MALCGLLGAVWLAPVRPADVRAEQSVKAAITLRFASYVEWPEEDVSAGDFNIAVLGASDVAAQMNELAANRTVTGRPVRIRRIASLQDLGDAQVLYVGTDRRSDLRSLLQPLRGHSLLVVTEEEDALAAGSIINLLVADQRVRFEVSLQTARAAKLRISSDLLSLAVRVQR